MSSDPPASPPEPAHFARMRRVKRLLRFMPRRAVFHRYPLIGRFATLARRRSYLWSFKTAHVRPALYFGSILALLPVMGVQLPLAFGLALLLRCNLMVMGGLQFITNPVTAVPVYGATYWLGKSVIEASGFGGGLDVVVPETNAPPSTPPADPSSVPASGPGSPLPPSELGNDTPVRPDGGAGPPPAELTFSKRVGTAINALVIGGLICGALTGLILDFLWTLGARSARQSSVHARPPKSRHYGSTHPPPKPQ